MKKQNISGTVLAVLICSIAVFGLAYAYKQLGKPSAPLSAAETVRDFYNSWTAYPGNPLADKFYLRAKALTPELAGKIEQTIASFNQGGYDPVLCAQDKPESFEVKKTAEAGGARYVVEEKFGSAIKTLAVETVNINNSWKISDIICLSGGTEGRAQDQTLVGDYIREHLSELSPQKEVLGGKFYLTKITFLEGNKALVEYEDGHIALAALAEYSLGQNNRVAITAFKDLTGNFQQSGVLIKDNPGLKPGAWHLSYERAGQPALSAELVFNADSLCADENQTKTCSLAGLNVGSRVRITGMLAGNRLTVHTLAEVK